MGLSLAHRADGSLPLPLPWLYFQNMLFQSSSRSATTVTLTTSRSAFCAIILLLVASMAGCGKDARMAGEPGSDELDALVSGAGRLRIGMAQKEAMDALGEPSRQENIPWEKVTQLFWENLRGAHPGRVTAGFRDGKLVHLELVPANRPLPRVDAAAAASLERAEVVQKAVSKQLRMPEIEGVTGKRGGQVRLSVVRGYLDQPDRIVVARTWSWEVEPGGRALLVEERDDLAGQPITRKLR